MLLLLHPLVIVYLHVVCSIRLCVFACRLRNFILHARGRASHQISPFFLEMSRYWENTRKEPKENLNEQVGLKSPRSPLSYIRSYFVFLIDHLHIIVYHTLMINVSSDISPWIFFRLDESVWISGTEPEKRKNVSNMDENVFFIVRLISTWIVNIQKWNTSTWSRLIAVVRAM